MTGLEFCRCGHTRDSHVPGVGCDHVNASRRHPEAKRCTCSRFGVDGDLADSEVFLAKQLNHVVRKEGLDLQPVERDELMQVMRISLWRASTKFDSRSHIRFGSFASFEVYQDAIDELRSRRMFGRRGEYRLQPLPAPPDADDSWIIDQADPLEDDLGAGRLARVVAELTIDPPDAGSVDLRWASTSRDRAALGTVRERRRSEAEAAEGGDRRPGWRLSLYRLVSATTRVDYERVWRPDMSGEDLQGVPTVKPRRRAA